MKNNKDILYVVMPAYNEGGNICDIVESWIKVLNGKSKQSRLVVADSGSTDDTHEKLLKLKKKFKQLEILKSTNQYHGPKVIALYNYAIENGAEYIFQTDSDGQTNPKEFDEFWKNREKYDAVIGYRSRRGDGRVRALVEKIVCFLLRVFFGVSVPDANAPFRLMKSDLVKKYLNKLPKEYDLPNIMLTAYFARFREEILFKEITFKPRTVGENSINIRKIFRIGRESLLEFARFKKDMDKDDPEIPKRRRYHRIGSVAIVTLFAIISLLAISVSPSSPWNRSETVTDSGVFLTIGTQMKNGLTPYTDTFDHKGPLLYIINYLGVMINETSGIMVFEFFAIFLSAVFFYKIAHLRVDRRWVCVLLAIASLSLYLVFNEIDRGNMAEEYAMPLIAISLYIFLKFFSNGKASLLSVFVAGACFSCVALLRLNMAVFWMGFSLVILVKMLYEKKFLELGKYIGSFILGISIVLLPVTVWLACAGAFQAFIDVYIMFNLEYSRVNASHIVDTILYFLKEALIFFSLVLSVYYVFSKSETNEKILFAAFIIAFVMEYFASCLSGNVFPHYGIALVPFTVFPFSVLFQRIENNEGNVMILSLFLLLLTYPSWINGMTVAATSFHNRNEGEAVSEPILKACQYIEDKTAPSDTIAVYGNLNYLYLRCKRLPASKYSYQYPIVGVRREILNEFFEDIDRNHPKIFIVQGGYNNRAVKDFLERSDYKLEWAEENPDRNGMRIYSLE